MLSKKLRANVADFAGKKPTGQLRSPYFRVKRFKIATDGKEMAVVVSSKVLSSAVSRNSLKRSVYKGLSSLSETLEEGFAYVFYALPKTAEILKNKDAIVEQLEILLKGKFR